MADNPMVTSMGAMLGNAQMMAAMGPIVRINRQSFLNQDVPSTPSTRWVF